MTDVRRKNLQENRSRAKRAMVLQGGRTNPMLLIIRAKENRITPSGPDSGGVFAYLLVI